MGQPQLAFFQGKALKRVIRWTMEGLELVSSDIDPLLRVVSRAMDDPTGDPETALRYFVPPDRAPAIADVEVGPGIVMAQRLRPFKEMDRRILSTIGAEGYGGPLWDVFSWSGEYLGVLDFGANVEVFGVQEEAVVGIEEDSLGVARPFLARLPRELTVHLPEG
jgi:hypothetical protein